MYDVQKPQCKFWHGDHTSWCVSVCTHIIILWLLVFVKSQTGKYMQRHLTAGGVVSPAGSDWAATLLWHQLAKTLTFTDISNTLNQDVSLFSVSSEHVLEIRFWTFAETSLLGVSFVCMPHHPSFNICPCKGVMKKTIWNLLEISAVSRDKSLNKHNKHRIFYRSIIYAEMPCFKQ